MKALFTFLLSATILSLYAQVPVNDNCSGLIDLGEVPYCSTPGQYTNVNATLSNIDPLLNVPACFNGNPERDVWFQFTTPSDGSIVDVSVTVLGNIGGNGTMKQPQVAVYRGDCVFGGLSELDCAAANLNVNEVQVNLFGLTPGLPYYLRINDFSATAAPNWGTFKLCVEKYIPEINIGTVATTGSCTGTLFDSGGPTGDYSPNENLEISICPQEFHQCIILNVENYAMESGSDYLHFFIGDNSGTGTQLTQLTGASTNFEIQIPGNCATVQFVSDGFIEDTGFKITWTCSPDACTSPPITSCANPEVIPTLPYTNDGLSNCFSGNTINDGPCGNEAFLSGNDYVFSYTSPGQECVQILTSGTNEGAGIGVYGGCPTLAGSTCIVSAGGGFTSVDPFINAAFLENPGTYYFVFGAGDDCSPFNITVDTITCPVILPPASTCDNALNIGGCNTTLPEIIALNPGDGDPGFLTPDMNAGCFVNPQFNYAFFYFTAAADGKFGFTVQAADPNESSDIDFNVWGPINNVANICDFTANNQPIRSSWTGGQLPTGLSDVNPDTGDPVTDDFDCDDPATPGAGGDRFVRRINVLAGQTYVILLDDFSNAIEQGGISIDFGGTTTGVLNSPGSEITVTADTAICPGQSLQLQATGGEAYFWSPVSSLSCGFCDSPVASPVVSTSYQVQIVTTCNTISRIIDVDIIDINLGPNAFVCAGAEFTLNPHPYVAPGAVYEWSGGPGLSCGDCPSPTLSLPSSGIYIYFGTLTTPTCTVYDTILVTVYPAAQPQYIIAENQALCAGASVSLGGNAFPGSFYEWTASTGGFTSTDANPTVTPTQTSNGQITYYLSTQNGTCPVPVLDSVIVSVYQSPLLSVQGDTIICNGESVTLGTTFPEAGVTYAWTPANGSLDNPASANPVATPVQSTLYQLVASNPGCSETRSLQVSIVNLTLQLSVPDTVKICAGTAVPITATVSPATTAVNWSPIAGLQISNGGQTVVAKPVETTFYTATASLPGCIRTESVYIPVDSLPFILNILPADTSVCQGSPVILRTKTYEPSDFPNMTFQWDPLDGGLLTSDTLFNLVVTPTVTTTYTRTVTNGGCLYTSNATVKVIQPAEMAITPADTSVCFGQSVQLTLTYTIGVTDIKWDPFTSLSCETCNTPLATPSSTTTYTASGKFDGCDVSASALVKVKAPPAIVFPADANLCLGESVTLNLANDPTATYVWTSTDPTFGTVTGAQPTVTPTQTATYFVAADNGCQVQKQITITVTNATLTVSGDTTICKGLTTTLTAASNLPGTFLWNNGQTGQAINVSPPVSTTYTVVYTATGTDCVLTGQVTVQVQGEAAEIVFPTDVGLCPGESVALNSVSTPGATYSWTSTPAGFTSSSPTPTVMPTQTTTYNVTATVDNCILTRQITVVAYNATLTLPADQKVCPGQPVQLVANASTTGDYLWSTGATTASISPVLAPATTTTYGLVFTYGDGCILTDNVMVMVAPAFSVRIESDPDTNRISVGETLNLTAIISPTQTTTFQYAWQENMVPVGTSASVITVNPTTALPDSATITYTVIATSSNGCTQEATYQVIVLQPNVQFPNAFTPGNDDLNNTFKMVVLEGLATIDKMEIYNRWGQKIFTSNEPNAEWDGNIDGTPAVSDVYVYVVLWRKGDGTLQSKKGDVTLLR